MGSKDRHAKELLPIILKDRLYGQCYVEPFVGGANMIDKVDGKRNRNAVKQSPLLQDVNLFWSSYLDLEIPQRSIIYCDPLYEGTTKYKSEFDHDTFWKWCRDMTGVGHSVFISEYNAPDDFECVWEKTVNNSLTKDTGGKQGVEKLFIYKHRVSFL